MVWDSSHLLQVSFIWLFLLCDEHKCVVLTRKQERHINYLLIFILDKKAKFYYNLFYAVSTTMSIIEAMYAFWLNEHELPVSDKGLNVDIYTMCHSFTSLRDRQFKSDELR